MGWPKGVPFPPHIIAARIERQKKTVAQRSELFWGHVNKDGPAPSHVPGLGSCWIWTGAKGHRGYGRFGIGGRRSTQAPRFALEEAIGPLGTGLCALHRCDNPPCVRPDHLFAGSCADNSADAVAKGRCAKGTRIGGSKLTEDNVISIRRLSADGMDQRTIAKVFYIHESTVSLIVRRGKWRHVA